MARDGNCRTSRCLGAAATTMANFLCFVPGPWSWCLKQIRQTLRLTSRTMCCFFTLEFMTRFLLDVLLRKSLRQTSLKIHDPPSLFHARAVANPNPVGVV